MVDLRKINAISKYFFKKNAKDIISFSIILLIATCLFASAINVFKNVSVDYDKSFDELNTADSFFTIPYIQYTDELLKDIESIEGVREVESQRGIMLSIPVKMEESTQEQTQIFYNIDETIKLNKRKVIEETNNDDLGVYLANYTFLHSGLKLNDKYEFEINNIPYSFKIIGVINEMQYGNYASSVIGEYLKSDSYNKLLENNKDKEVVTIAIKSDDSKKTYTKVSKYFANENINVLNKNEKDNIKNGRLVTTNIIVLILMIFSSIILIISLFVSKFKIGQTLEEELTNMGVLKALGYTSKEIIISSIMPYIIMGVICSIVGISLSYFLLPILSQVIEMQSGFIWKSKIDIGTNIFVFGINLILITIFTLTASLKIRKLNPINAIRGLTESKNVKNYFEIEKTTGNIHFILMLKNFINTKKQNLLLGIVLFFITIVASFLGILFYNVNMNPLNFVNTLVEEHPSIVVSSNRDLRDKLSEEENVKNVIYYDENVSLNYQGNSYKTFVAENFNTLANDLCYEGVNPKNKNEIAIGSKLREDFNINIGDYIALNKNNVTKEYKVVGFIQSVNYFGEIMEMTLDGYTELDSLYQPTSIYVYLENEDDETSKEFIKHIESKYESDIISTMNYVESMNSAVAMFIPLISVICIVIIVIALLLIYLILYIVLNGIITRKKQELGIFKAMGYENKQLVRQIVGGFIPSVIISSLAGLIVSKLSMNIMYSIIFGFVGAYRVSFVYPITIFILVTVLIILGTLIIGNLLARKIKKISVYSLIKD